MAHSLATLLPFAAALASAPEGPRVSLTSEARVLQGARLRGHECALDGGAAADSQGIGNGVAGVGRRAALAAAAASAMLFFVAEDSKAADAGVLSKYIKRKKLDPLDTYVPTVLLAQIQFQDVDEKLVGDKPDFADARSMLRNGPAGSLRNDIRAYSTSSAIHTPTASVDRVLPPKSRLTWRRLLTGAVLGSVIGGGAYVGTSDEATISNWAFQGASLLNPLFKFFEPEDAHRLAIWAAAHGLVPKETRPDPFILEVTLWGRTFSNPVGLAAGFDKNAEAVEGLLGLGFGFVEVGSVTPVPQEGNPRPRVFRIQEQGAIINRYGFSSEGIVAVARRLGAQHGKRRLAETTGELFGSASPFATRITGTGIVGVNLGKNKTSEDAAADYVQGVHTLSQYADYLVINVSSPNTPGLRKLQGRKQLQDLIKKVLAARDEMQWGEAGPPPLLVKISPDLSKQDLADIAAVALSLRIDGLVVTNTTVSRPDSILGLVHSTETGGLSGKPLFNISNEILRDIYVLTKGKIPLVGCGGISSGEDAYKKIRAGASLVELYTAFAYEGPAILPRIKSELASCLERDGFKSIREAVGADHR